MLEALDVSKGAINKMNKFEYENQGTHTYLVYTVAEDDIIDSMSLGMLTNNKIHGLAQTLFTQMDEIKYIKYDVSAKISVKQFFTGQVNKKRLIGVFNGIVDAMLSAEDYMIDINSIFLDLDYMFADVSTCETVLICLPIVSDDFSRKDLGAFFKSVMFTTQFDQTENCDHVAKIINYLNSSPVFSLAEFKEVLGSINVTSSVAAGTTMVQQPVATGAVPVRQVENPIPKQPLTTPSMAQSPAPQPICAGQSTQSRTFVQKPQNLAPTQPITPPSPAVQSSAVPMGEQEKKMSWFYLMQHYSKENAATYKAQKAAKKSGQPQPIPAPAAQPKKQSAPATGFAIPGQNTPVNQGFAIPGQATPVPANLAQAAPGQAGAAQAAPVQRPIQAPVQPKAPVAQPAPGPAPQAAPQPAPRPAPQAAPQPMVNRPVYTQPQMPQGQFVNFGETTVLGVSNIGETTVLGATPATQVKPHLIRSKNNEKIDLNKPVFRIGKEKSYVDYFIGDNSAISRSHANVISRDGEYFVVDTNSTNHTYVNGQMIQSNVETKIAHGAKIKLANEDFEFRLY